jgi:hypothetical protein
MGAKKQSPAGKQGQAKLDPKDSHFRTQYQTVYESFQEKPKTMLSVSIETGILRANICRYVADMENKGLIQLIRKDPCHYTQFKAGFYSTDKDLFTKSNFQQLNLFDDVRV